MGGKSTRKVYDFLMSIDYGLCMGPVDSFNKIWVKDKPIWCGEGKTDQVVDVNLPDLFGGDDGEGGPVGKLELYVGSDTQVSSDALASRVGRTSETMPGYRGLAHVFFRGNGDGGGFRWTSNNPYLPEMKASVTRIPRTLNSTTAIVPPIIGFEDDGTLIRGSSLVSLGGDASYNGSSNFPVFRSNTPLEPEDVDTKKPLVVDLYDMGYDADAIATGDVEVFANWDIHLQHPGGPSGTAGDPVAGTFEIEVSFFSAPLVPSDEFDYGRSPDLGTTTHPFSGTGEHNIRLSVGSVPVGAQWATVRARYGSVDHPFPNLTVDFRSFVVTDAGENAAIPGFAAYAEPTGSFEDDPPRWVDLEDYYPREVIDTGLVTITAEWELLVKTSGGADNATTTSLNFGWWPALDPFPDPIAPATTVPPEDGYDPDNEIDDDPSGVTEYAGSGPVVSSITKTVPAGTRYITIRGGVATLFPLFAVVHTNEKNVRLSGPKMGYGHCLPDAELGRLPDANPSHIIHELLVNDEWGDGQLPTRINTTSFEGAAQTLYDEGFGLSLIWVEQDSIKAIIQEVIDHIRAVVYLDPETGLWEITLLRDDYDTETLETLNPSNCDAVNRKRRLWGQTINQIDAEYTDPATEKGAVVTAHDLGNIAMQGKVRSDKRPYFAVRNPYLATILAERDVAEAALPLFSCEVKVDRTRWRIKPGSVQKFSWPEDGIVDMIVRVMKVDYGSSTDRQITLTVVEDVFAYEKTRYDAPQGSLWTPGNALPVPLDAEVPYTTPLPMLMRGGLTVDEVDENYPAVAVTLLGSDDDDSPRPIDLAIYAEGTTPSGASIDERVAVIDETYSALTTFEMVPEITSTIPGALVTSLIRDGGTSGDWLVIGESEDEQEIVMLDAYDSGTNTWTITRGVWDTLPGEWPQGSRLWAMPDGLQETDDVERAAGETISYSFLPRTSVGRLELSDAVPVEFTATARPHQPFRPANCEIDGNGFGPTNYQEPGSQPTDLTITWKDRNRTSEDQLALAWDDDSAAVEVGQTTVLRVYDADGIFVKEVADLTGESYTFAVADLETQKGHIEFLSERDGLRSRTGAIRFFDLSIYGYGYAYGYNYGGARGWGLHYGENYGD